MKPLRRGATYDDLCSLPEHRVGEIIDGELYSSPRPASPHARAASMIGGDLCVPFDRPPGSALGPGGWWILDEPELHLSEDVLVPDLAGWRRDRMPVIPNVPAFDLAPDWACEVVSPSTGWIDRGKKMHVYARERVKHLWMVDPILQTLEVYRLDGPHWIVASTHARTDRVHAEPFAEIELNLSRWWLDPAGPE